MFKKIATSFFCLIIFFSLSLYASAYVMSGTNYRLEKDSINIGGLESSSSDNYGIVDTIGEMGTGDSESDNYFMKAGYRQIEEGYISITNPNSISLTPSIAGLTGGVADGEGTWNIKTDVSAGYHLNIKASSEPALQSETHSFSDYTSVIPGTPDFNWDIDLDDSEFGFSSYNSLSQIAKYKNNGSACNVGENITEGKCWNNLSSSYETIINKTSRTDIDGEDTKIKLKAEVAGLQASGEYTAEIVVTAISN